MKKAFRHSIILILLYLVMGGVIASSFASAQEVERIQPDELKKLIESKADIVIVDNQPKISYEMEHIPGAVNFPWAMEIKFPVNLPRNKVLILYCACSHEEDSMDVASQLIKRFGYKDIKLLEGGWLRWVELGYPIKKK